MASPHAFGPADPRRSSVHHPPPAALATGIKHLAVGVDHLCFAGDATGVSCVGWSLIAGDLAVERWSQSDVVVGNDIQDPASNGETMRAR